MMRFHLLGIVITLLSSAAPAVASSNADPIIVTGKTPGQVTREAYAFVRELGAPMGNRQTARWSDPICPRAIGVSSTYAAIVERQIRDVAKAVGAPLASDTCQPNFVIAFTTEGGSLVRKIDRRDPGRLQALRRPAQEELKQGDLPIRWWYNTWTLGRDGRQLLSFPPLGLPSMGDQDTKFLALYEPGRISTSTTRGIHDVSIVIDVSEAEGKRLSSLIDYAAMVGLAEVKLGAAPPRSILSLFEESSAPQQLTAGDRSFLTALYKMAMDRPPSQQRQTLVNSIVRAKKAE